MRLPPKDATKSVNAISMLMDDENARDEFMLKADQPIGKYIFID